MASGKHFDGPDHLTRIAAFSLAARIRNAWAARGYEVDVWVESFRDGFNNSMHCVRSNLIDGLPRGEEKKCLKTMLQKSSQT